MSDHTRAPAEAAADAKGRMYTLARQMSGHTTGHMVGQVAPVEGAAAPIEDWDPASAEALMQVYEDRQPTVYYADPPAAPAAPKPHRPTAMASSATKQSASAYGDAPLSAAIARSPVSATPALADLAQDRAWLDGRFSDLATRLEETMKRLDPAEQIAPMAKRLDGLEGHLRAALADVVRKDAFAGLEVQIGDVQNQLATARLKLERLDGIEAKLGALTSLAESANDVPAMALQATPNIDIEAMLSDAINRTAARTAERMAAAPVRTAAPEGMGELRTLVSGYVDEYRREQSQTSAALATMQEALVRLIDRIDQYDEEAVAVEDALAEPELAAPVHPPAARFVEVADERGSRSGRRMSDVTDTARDVPHPNLDPSAPPAARAEPRLAASQHTHPEEVASPARAPRRVPGTVTANPDQTTAAEAMAAERARIAAERTAQASSRRPTARGPTVREPEPQSGNENLAASMVQEPLTVETASTIQTTGKTTGKRKATAAASSPAKRGLMVAGIGALVIGVSASAHIFISSRMAAPKLEDRVPSSAVGSNVGGSNVGGSNVGGSNANGPRISPRPQSSVLTPSGAASPQPEAPRNVLVPSAGSGSGPTPGLTIVQPGDPRAQPVRGAQPVAQQPTAPQTLPEGFKPKSVPETIDDDLQSNARPQPGSVRQSTAVMSGIALDNGALPNPSELARRMTAPGPANANQQAGLQPMPAQPISTATQPEAAPQIDVTARSGPVEMPPAVVGPTSLRTAAQQGDPAAQFEVAARFAEGKGMKQDFQQAITWYTRASQKGFIPAQYRLATLYERGLGMPADITRAKVWYRRAADQGNVKSMHNLAVLAAGPQQADPDYPTASRWFTEAAERGLADSQFNLGVLTENGLGMQKDPMQAYKWFALAARSGDKEAARRRDQMAAAFTPEQARAAELLVTSWRAKPLDMKANDPRAAGLAWAAERDSAAQAAAQKQTDQRQQQQTAPMPLPPPAATPPSQKAAKVTRS